MVPYVVHGAVSSLMRGRGDCNGYIPRSALKWGGLTSSMNIGCRQRIWR